MPLGKARFGGGAHCIRWCEASRSAVASILRTNSSVDFAAADQSSSGEDTVSSPVSAGAEALLSSIESSAAAALQSSMTCEQWLDELKRSAKAEQSGSGLREGGGW